MKYLIILSIFLISCSTTQDTYKWSLENRDYAKRPGYEGKPFQLQICNSKVDAVLVLERYTDECKFEKVIEKKMWKKRSYSWEFPAGYYYMTVAHDGKIYQDSGQPYQPAHTVWAEDYIFNLIYN